MTTQKTPEYRVAEQFTWMSRVEGRRYLSPPEKMGEPYPFLGPFEVVPGVVVPASIGYQALAITADPNEPGRFLMSHYYAPAVKAVRIKPTDDGGLELCEDGVIAWAKTPWGSDCRGGLPEQAPGSDAKRMQCVLRHWNGTDILVSRNGETNGFFQLSPYEVDGKQKWRVVGYLHLKGDHPPNHYIESAVIERAAGLLHVLRSKQDGTPAWLEAYSISGERAPVANSDLPPETPFLYGIGYCYGRMYYITSVWKNVTVERGIYCGRQLVVPGICGDGIAFDPRTGDAYVTQYNDGNGHQATPAFVIRVPARYFETKK